MVVGGGGGCSSVLHLQAAAGQVDTGVGWRAVQGRGAVADLILKVLQVGWDVWGAGVAELSSSCCMLVVKGGEGGGCCHGEGVAGTGLNFRLLQVGCERDGGVRGGGEGGMQRQTLSFLGEKGDVGVWSAGRLGARLSNIHHLQVDTVGWEWAVGAGGGEVVRGRGWDAAADCFFNCCR